MPPLSPAEILTGILIGALLRAMIIGVLGLVVLKLFLHIPIHSLGLIFIYALLGNLMMAALGVAAGLWSEKFDHLAAVTNFIVTPLTFLAGTFYALTALPQPWQNLALLNPFFYMIDGFRAGFIGVAEASLTTGMSLMAGFTVVLIAFAYWLLKSGYKIRS
jgi:ABC-2 type transport system permease protein